MKKTYVLILSVILVAAMAACAPQEITLTPTAAQTSTITVQATAETELVPDIAVVSLGVSVRAATPAAARENGSEKINAILAVLDELGIAKEDIQTSQMNIWPYYNYTNNTETLAGYRMESALSITVRDIAKAGDIVDQSIAVGGNTLNGISYELSDDTAAYELLLKDAIDSARGKADIIAAAAGKTVTEVQSVVEDLGTYNYTYRVNAETGGADAKESATVLMSGTQTVTASVTVVFTIG